MLSLSSSSLCKLVFLTADSLFYLNIVQPPTTVINSARKKKYTITVFMKRVCVSYLEKCTEYEIVFAFSKCQESIRSDEWK